MSPEPETSPPKRRHSQKPPWGEGADSERVSFGTWLRRQRELRQISLREIAESSKISLRYLEAFEQDRFDLLPASVFAKGFLRQYAGYVGVDPDEVLNYYLWARQSEESHEEPVETDVEEPRPVWSYGLISAVAGILFLLLLILLVIWANRRNEPAYSERPSIAPPVVQEVANPAPVVPSPLEEEEEEEVPLLVTVDFTQDCWVDAIVDGGRERISELRVQGESLRIEAEDSVVFQTLGNAGGVTVEVNGYPLDLRVKPGAVIHDLKIDVDTARALAEGTT